MWPAPGRSRGAISIRRISLGGGYRYLMESVAAGDGAAERSNGLARYYATSGTPPGLFLGAGLADLDGGNGVETGTTVTEAHLELMLAGLADPVSGMSVAGGRSDRRLPRRTGSTVPPSSRPPPQASHPDRNVPNVRATRSRTG